MIYDWPEELFTPTTITAFPLLNFHHREP